MVKVGQSEKISFIQGEKQKLIVDPEELPKYFSHLYLFGRKKYNYIGYCPIKQVKESISLRCFQIKSPMSVSLTLYQKDQKYFQENIKYCYSWIRAILLLKEPTGKGYRWIDGRYDNQKSLTINTDVLETGQYHLIIMPEWRGRTFDVNLILRAKVPVPIERKPYTDGILEEGCTDLAQRFGRLNQLNKYVCAYNCVHEDLGIIIENINN